MKTFSVQPIGVIRSELKNIEDAPSFYTEGAPNALLEVFPAYLEGLDRMQVGDEIIVITWLHRARREVLKVHPRGDAARPLQGYSRLGHQIVRIPWGFIARGCWK